VAINSRFAAVFFAMRILQTRDCNANARGPVSAAAFLD
jgi:hypothetical protein